MDKVLESIFGKALREESYQFPPGTPFYISYGYDVSRIYFGGKSSLLVSPKTEGWNLASLKKQIRTIEKITGEPVIVELSRLSALQRTNLIGEGIAFVSGKGQVFVPFWGSYFEEKILNPAPPAQTMTANAQLVFLHMFYQGKQDRQNQKQNQTRIAKALNMPKSTCTRAIRLLHDLGLLELSEEGAANIVSLKGEGNILEKAYPYMASPVQKLVYVRALPPDIPFKLSGLKALAERTMLASLESDSGYAVNRDDAKRIGSDFLIDVQEFHDFGGSVIEVWNYDPALLSESGQVDDISLLLELDGETDERIQKELDEIRRKYDLTGE